MCADGISKGHFAYHRGIANCLKLHMTAIFSSLKFDDDKIGFFIDT